MGKLLLLLTVIPLVELVVLLRVGARLGVGTTIGIILLTGVVGAILLRTQGVAILRDMQRSLAQGKTPAREMVEGLMVLVGGVTLLTPGFVTDIIGVILLVPLTRRAIAAAVLAYITAQVKAGRWQVVVQNQQAGSRSDTIDGEFRRM